MNDDRGLQKPARLARDVTGSFLEPGYDCAAKSNTSNRIPGRSCADRRLFIFDFRVSPPFPMIDAISDADFCSCHSFSFFFGVGQALCSLRPDSCATMIRWIRHQFPLSLPLRRTRVCKHGSRHTPQVRRNQTRIATIFVQSVREIPLLSPCFVSHFPLSGTDMGFEQRRFRPLRGCKVSSYALPALR